MFSNSLGCNASVLGPERFLSCLRDLPADSIVPPMSGWGSPVWPNAPGGRPPAGYVSPLAPLMP